VHGHDGHNLHYASDKYEKNKKRRELLASPNQFPRVCVLFVLVLGVLAADIDSLGVHSELTSGIRAQVDRRREEHCWRTHLQRTRSPRSLGDLVRVP
jgi:hypothetical protein